MFVNEYVNEVHAHVRRLLVELEEATVIALRQGLPHVQGMDHAWVFLLLGSQLLHHPKCLHLHAAENLVKNLVCEEFL